MKTIYVCSDLHIDFYRLENSKISLEDEFELQMSNFLLKADYLIIAGDISNNMHYMVEFLKWVSKKYEKVLWTHGNHDYVIDGRRWNIHGKNIDYLAKINKLVCDNVKNVIWLNRSGIYLDGTTEIIGTMGVADFTYGKKIAPEYNFPFYCDNWYRWYDGAYWGIPIWDYLTMIESEKKMA